MTLEKTVRQKLSKWQHLGSGRQHLLIAADGAGWTIDIAADRADELGCLVWEVTAQRRTPLAADAATLRAWAERLAGRVKGLIEPLCVVEVDALRLEAQLRSQQPIALDEQTYYHEVLLTAAGKVTLRRYQSAQKGAQHAQVAFAQTHEALARLAADLTAEK